jgi:hypothetical protein
MSVSTTTTVDNDLLLSESANHAAGSVYFTYKIHKEVSYGPEKQAILKGVAEVY